MNRIQNYLPEKITALCRTSLILGASLALAFSYTTHLMAYTPPEVDAFAIASHLGVMWGTAEVCEFPKHSLFGDKVHHAIKRSKWNSGDRGRLSKHAEDSRHAVMHNPDMHAPVIRKFVCTKEKDTYLNSPVWNSGWEFEE